MSAPYSSGLQYFLSLGTSGDRPVSLNLHPSLVGIRYETDAGLFVWDGSDYIQIVGVDGAVSTIEELTDVSIDTSLVSGDYLKFNGTHWVNAAGATAPSGSANTPLFNNGSSGFTNGTRSGNTTEVATVTGSKTSGNLLSWDASGNAVDSGVSTVTAGTGTPGGSDKTIQYNNSSAFGGIGPLTDGQLVIGSTGATSVAASLTQPAAGLSITGGAGTVTFALANDLAALEGMSGTGMVSRIASETYAQRTITGTSNRISITNGDGASGNPTIDISSSYVGQNTITTLGTIGTGTWQGSVIGSAYGGAGTINGALKANGSGTVSAAYLDDLADINIDTSLAVGDGLRFDGSSFANYARGAKAQAQWVSGAIVANTTVYLIYKAPYGGTINSLDYFTGNGSFTVAININGANVTGLSAVSVSSSSPANTNATAANTFSAGDTITAVITSASSSPTDALLNLNMTWV